MGSIYQGAEKVIVWLGEEADDSEAAFALIRMLQAREPIWRVESSAISFHVSPAALNILCMRDYWNRVWVIQEVALARNVSLYCGKDSMEWRSMNEGIAF